MKLRPFLFFTIISSIIIAGTAALFSVTGISMLFAGHKLEVGIMAGALEAGKIVIASILYRYWTVMSKLMKSYMAIALFVLMGITSAGIFGYLSDAYQETKGTFDITNKEIQLLESKKQLFQNEYDRYQERLNDLIGNRQGQESRLDSLYARNYITSARRVEAYIKQQDDQILDVNNKILAASDSISAIETRIIEKENINVSGELGPLVYLSNAFNTDMDTVVKWLILILIFVFDPLAVTLIVAANMIYINKHYERPEWTEIFGNKKFGPRQIIPKPDNPDKEPGEPDLSEEDRQEMRKYEESIGIEKSIEALPADKNVKILDNTNPSEISEAEVKSDAPNIDIGDKPNPNDKIPEGEPKPKKKRRWKSANWHEPPNSIYGE